MSDEPKSEVKEEVEGKKPSPSPDRVQSSERRLGGVKNHLNTSTMVLLLVFMALLFALAGYLVGVNRAVDDSATATATPTGTPTASVGATTSVTASASATVDLTANWKIYTKTIYDQGISFKYPENWTVQMDSYNSREPGYTLTIQNGDKNQFVLYVARVLEAAPDNLNQVKTDLTETAKSGGFNVVFSDIKIDGQSAVKIGFSNLNDLEKPHRGNPQADVINNGIYYTLEAFNDGGATFDQILSTFQFTK